MRLVGTTRTAVAVLLAAASLASSGAGESPTSEVAVAAGMQARTPKPVTVAWGGDVTLGSSYGLPPAGGKALLAAGKDVLRRAAVGGGD
jgi:hypothetical protein